MSYSIKDSLISDLRRNTKQYVNDLKHLGPELISQSPGGKARTPLHFTAEVGFYNKLAAEQLKTGEMPSTGGPEEREKMFNSIKTLDEAIQHIESGTEALVAEVEGKSDEELTSVIETFFGPMPVCDYVNVISAHISYHDGQLNYIQALNGDDEFHFND